MRHRVNAKIVTLNNSMRRYAQLTIQGERRYNKQLYLFTLLYVKQIQILTLVLTKYTKSIVIKANLC